MTSLTKSPDTKPAPPAPLDNAEAIREEMFARKYLETFDAAVSWLAVTPDGGKKYAVQNGAKWLKKPTVRALLQKLAAVQIAKADVAAERIIEELEHLVFLDPWDFLEVDGEGEPVLDLTTITPEKRRLLDIEFGIGVSKDGDRIRTYKVKPRDRDGAIDKLLKIHQLYKGDDLQKQPMAIQVNVNFPLPASNWRDNQADQPDDIDPEDV